MSTNRIRTAWTKLSAYRQPLLSRLAQSWATVQTFLARVLANAQPVVTRVWSTIKSLLAKVWEKAQPLLQETWERIRPAMTRGWSLIEPYVARVWTKVEPHATKLWTKTAPARELASEKLTNVKQRWDGTSAHNRRRLTGVASVVGIAVLGLGLIGTAPGTPSDENPTPAAATSEERTEEDGNRDDSREESSESDETEATTESDDNSEEEKNDEEPEPVGGLDETQMDNAVAIVEAGQDEGVSERGQAAAVATAMQESKMKNLASDKLPESFEHTSEGSGNDHDSVGLFQQRPSSGWGSIEDCMDPEKSAKSFYSSLEAIDGWEDMSITQAAQEVQVSAYPDAYAQWEDMAWDVVDEVNDKS